jgi:hypothetical protein
MHDANVRALMTAINIEVGNIYKKQILIYAKVDHEDVDVA